MTGDGFQHVLVLGATGYVGGRLVPELTEAGHRVRCLTRSAAALRDVPWADAVDVVQADLTEPETLPPAFDRINTVVYLVHSLGRDSFEEVERRTARNVCEAAEAAGVEHIVYMSGLGREDDDLSPHLRSRHAVGVELAKGTASVTELRAAVVLGAGSASFEMLRSLVEVLPAIIAPTWVTRTLVEPIAVRDVLHYLTVAIERGPAMQHDIVEIGGGDRVTYRELMDLYADVAGLRRRRVVPVPFLPLRFSTFWVDVVTPLPGSLAGSLIASLRNDVVVTSGRARQLSPSTPLSARRAIEVAISAISDLDIPSRWSGVTTKERAARPQPADPDWSGGTVYEDRRSVVVDVSSVCVPNLLQGTGGGHGRRWFRPRVGCRGIMDLVGGTGPRNGGRHPSQITVGERIGRWRVEAFETDLLRLSAETRLAGAAWLEWSSTVITGGRTGLVQHVRFVPRGIAGRLYWWVLWPARAAILPLMVRRLGHAATQAVGSAASPGSTEAQASAAAR